jgi:Matrixin
VSGLPPPPPSGAPVPPRPDLAIERRRRAGWAAPLIGLLTIAVLLSGLLGLASIEDGELASSAPGSPRSPVPSSTATPSTSDGYRISERISTGLPMRWTQCTITYRLISPGAPSHGADDVEEAFRRLSEATGFRFERLDDHPGPVAATILEVDASRDPDGTEIMIGWLPHREYVRVRKEVGVRDSIAWATNFLQGFGAASHYDGAYVVIDLRWSRRSGFHGWWSHGMTVLHELGHVVGLDHVKDREQVMYAGRRPVLGLSDWGDGDLEGLEVVGAPASCAA